MRDNLLCYNDDGVDNDHLWNLGKYLVEVKRFTCEDWGVWGSVNRHDRNNGRRKNG